MCRPVQRFTTLTTLNQVPHVYSCVIYTNLNFMKQKFSRMVLCYPSSAVVKPHIASYISLCFYGNWAICHLNTSDRISEHICTERRACVVRYRLVGWITSDEWCYWREIIWSWYETSGFWVIQSKWVSSKVSVHWVENSLVFLQSVFACWSAVEG